MRVVLPVSILLGLIWNLIAVCLMGGKPGDAFTSAFTVAGAVAGVTAGIFTVWSRRKTDGQERVVYVIATYYLSIFVYWMSFVVIERIWLCIRHGGWTDFDLHDHLSLILVYLLYGTVWYGIILIPLCFLTRHVLWKMYVRCSP